MTELKGQSILILGLGSSGLAMARWCARCGADVTVADTRQSPPQLEALGREVPGARFIQSNFDDSLLDVAPFAAVFKSPGLTPASVDLLARSTKKCFAGIKGEMDLFCQALEDLNNLRAYAPTVLAITGTNGKTTVTSLTGQLIERANKSVAVAGNIGPSLLETLAGHLDSGVLPEVWVIELSSFQLDSVQGFEPTAAAVLNITQDHLDWHGSMSAYTAAKSKIFGSRTKMVLNREDPLVMGMLPVSPEKGRVKDYKLPDYETFGSDMPQRPGDFGLEQVNGMVWLVRAMKLENVQRKRNQVAEELFIQRLLPADALRIRGRHNAVNALTALSLATSAGCSIAPILFGLREYRGEPHRVESVAIINGVEFFDDSKGTNVGATVAALHGLGLERKLVVILGGDGKGQDFSPLVVPVQRFARAVVLIGRDAPLIKAALSTTGVPLVDAATLELAVAATSQLAHSGDAVLLSPACASLDMFDNYAHRAAVFRDAVAVINSAAELAMGVHP